jgi:hypothetical protein
LAGKDAAKMKHLDKEKQMGMHIRQVIWTVILCSCVALVCFDDSSAKDKKITPEEVVSNHIKSIGSEEVLAGIKSRAFSGSTSVNFIQGAVGNLTGQCEFVSEKQKLGILLKYTALEYPQEHFAYDGKDVTIGYISPGIRSPLGDFLNRFSGIIEQGFLGGVLSLNWPLLDIEEARPKMKYEKSKIDGRELHELEYRPRKGMGDVKLKLYFDWDTFHHVRTEYKVAFRKQGAIESITGGMPRDSSDAEIYFQLIEEYGDFRDVDGLMLPHTYSLHFSREGGGSTFMARWVLNAAQWSHNGPIAPEYYHAQ